MRSALRTPTVALSPYWHTKKSKNCHSEKTVLIIVYKLTMSAEKRWHRIRGNQSLNLVIKGMKFEDGVLDQEEQPTDNKPKTVTV